MRQIRFRITDALQHGELAALPEREQRLERRMQSGSIGELDDLFADDRKLRPKRVIRGARVWHEGVESIVAALELD